MHLGLRGRVSRERSCNRVFQIVSPRDGPCFAGIDPLIVDAAVINQLAGSVEDGRFGRDGGVRTLD